MIYPQKITGRIAALLNAREITGGNAVGTEANFSCGSFVRFNLSVDVGTAFVVDARFRSNGCGYMLAAADILADSVRKRYLSELHGLAAEELRKAIVKDLGEIPEGRDNCICSCINALRAAFADFRAMQIEEFRGEKALICTCFGVTEETIESKITEQKLETIDEVTDACNAGGGCGSCRMLIQEMLDNR